MLLVAGWPSLGLAFGLARKRLEKEGHGTGKSREPADWKVCATAVSQGKPALRRRYVGLATSWIL